MEEEKSVTKPNALDPRFILLGTLLICSLAYFVSEKLNWLPYFEPGAYQNLTHSDGNEFHPGWAYVLLWENYGNLVFAILGGVLFLLMLVKSQKFPKILAAYLPLGFVFLLSGTIIRHYFSPLANMDHSTQLTALVIALFLSATVVPFILKSEWAKTTFVNKSAGKRPRTIALLVVLILFAYATIGQTAFIKIYGLPTIDPKLAQTGISPFAMGMFGTALWYACFFTALWAWMSKKAIHGFSIGMGVGLAAFYVALAAPKATLHENASTTPQSTQGWRQDELTEEFMQSLSRNQCIEKTISYLQACGSDQCLRNAAGISADCIEFSQDSNTEFCSSFDSRHRQQHCSDDETSNICRLLDTLDAVFCGES